jgi:hypothetical protein
MRLMEDKITTTRMKREQTYTKRVISTWEPFLLFNTDPPNNEPNIWLTNSEVLVGRRMLRRPLRLSPTLPNTRGVRKLAFSLTPGP